MLGQDSGAQLAPIKFYNAGDNKTFTPAFWADRACEKILSVADTAPQPLRDQCLAFQSSLKAILLDVIATAVRERRDRDAMLAERKDAEIAQIIREDQ